MCIYFIKNIIVSKILMKKTSIAKMLALLIVVLLILTNKVVPDNANKNKTFYTPLILVIVKSCKMPSICLVT